MIVGYFGVPGSGKSTLLSKFAVQELKKIRKGKSKYKDVYTNFYVAGCKRIDYDDLDQMKVYDSLIILDEITLDADNRNFKSFPIGVRDFFILHRHLGCDIIYATQSYELVDKKIRQLTQELWYMSRTVVPFLRNFTLARRIYRTIKINEYTGELILGYRFCNLLELLFTSNIKTVFRPFYYRFFDSYDEGVLKQRSIFDSELWNDTEVIKMFDYIKASAGRKVARLHKRSDAFRATFGRTQTKVREVFLDKVR